MPRDIQGLDMSTRAHGRCKSCGQTSCVLALGREVDSMWPMWLQDALYSHEPGVIKLPTVGADSCFCVGRLRV